MNDDRNHHHDGATRRRLDAGRWLFQHGPIDCVVGADGEPAAVARAVEAAWRRFGTLLAELVAELPLLRADLSAPHAEPRGLVARRMVAACAAHASGGRFITAMAAVAGSVAQELIGFFEGDRRIVRAHVNNGGDIALHLAPGAWFDVGLVANVDAAALDGQFRITAESGVRGIATSGWRGRSLSLGIADSACVLAASAAEADAAATVIGNAVDVDDADDPPIQRAPADRVRDDSDLGRRLVTVGVAALPERLIVQALDAGAAQAEAEIRAGRIVAAVLCLQGRVRVCGRDFAALALQPRATRQPALV